jgi:hypothetical protein
VLVVWVDLITLNSFFFFLQFILVLFSAHLLLDLRWWEIGGREILLVNFRIGLIILAGTDPGLLRFYEGCARACPCRIDENGGVSTFLFLPSFLPYLI